MEVLHYFRERMFRLGVLGFMWDLSYYIAIPLGAWLFSFGYVHVFGSSMVLYVIACSFGLARLWNFKEKINKSDMSFKGIFYFFVEMKNQYLCMFYRLVISQECNRFSESYI